MYSLSERASMYNKAFPKYPPLVTTDRWLYGVWEIGNDYRNKTRLYGAYPPRYLDRVMSMFPDAISIMHLFSGSLPPGPYTRVDINPASKDASLSPDVIGDAHRLGEYFLERTFDLVLADPPYSKEDAVRYGFPMVNRHKVLLECAKLIVPSGFLVWLDVVKPMYRLTQWALVGEIAVVRSTNHRVRMVFIFQRR